LPHVKIYLNREDLKPIDLGKYLEKHYFTQKIIDIPSVFVGDEKVPMRLILYRLPKHIVEEKLREANKRAMATGRKMSRGKRLLLQFAAFVTNVSEELISAEGIGTIYRLRWEIELIFKRWKSQLRMDYLKGINKERIECLIWSRLCSLLIIEMVTGYIKAIARKMMSSNVEVSHNKAISYILRNSVFCKGVTQYRFEEFLKRLAKDIPRMLLKDKRARRTMRERADALDTYYDTQPSVNQWVA
jgi:hypothetical protein